MTQNHVFDAAVANVEGDIIYTAGDTTFRFGGDNVTPGTFEFFGVPPYLGRALEPTDFQSGAPPVFVMRYATGVSQFRADATLIGKIVNLNGVSHTLVGIMAPRFAWGGVELGLELSLYKILQILSVTVFEKTPMLEGFSNFSDEFPDAESSMQLNLFDF